MDIFIKNPELSKYLVNIEDKLKLLKLYCENQKQNKNLKQNKEILLVINRKKIWNSSLIQFLYQSKNVDISTCEFKIEFKQEEGIDAGGLLQEWYSLIFKELFDPNKGLFITSSNGITFQPSPLAIFVPDYQLHFNFAGKLLAKAILDEKTCEIELTRSFLKHMLGKQIYIQDLQDIDPDESQNLYYMVQNNITEDMCLTFSYLIKQFGEIKEIELIPNGKSIQVTNENKKLYAKLMAQAKMIDQIKSQSEAFLTGFFSVIPKEALTFFNETDLGLAISGIKNIDINDMKNNAKYNKYQSTDTCIQWFWEILEEFTQELRQKFLFFVTGSFKVPYGGFKNRQITIQKICNKELLPKSHTCSSEIELPTYESKQIMQDKILIAINEGLEGFYNA